MDFGRLIKDYNPRLLLDEGGFAEPSKLHVIIMAVCDNQVMFDNTTLTYKLDASNKRTLYVSQAWKLSAGRSHSFAVRCMKDTDNR